MSANKPPNDSAEKMQVKINGGRTSDTMI